MTVTEIQPGRLVKVEPSPMDAKDVIELAEALIENDGWLGNNPTMIQQHSGGNTSVGWTIHGAIGEAAKRATGASGKDTAEARPFRDQAAQLLSDADPAARTEMEINDQAQTQDEALAAMRAARGAS